MFTGIVEELGEVRGLLRSGGAAAIKIKAVKTSEDTRGRDRRALNGPCLAVVKQEDGIFVFEVIPETLKDTNLGALKIAEKVNLERSLKVGDRLSGHFVTGHVDCLGLIRRKDYRQNNLRLEIAIPAQFLAYCLPKGSIAVDGVSLTLQDRKANCIDVYLIKHTHTGTTLGLKGPSDKLNIEFDILAKKSSLNVSSV